MKTYIGTKIIRAEPGGCPKDDQKNKKGDPGYAVEYPGGYRSWSPKEVFEEAYRVIDNMNFGLAIEAMKKGERVALPGWKKDVYLSIQRPDESSKMTRPYIVTSRLGLVPWVATQTEMLSDEWRII